MYKFAASYTLANGGGTFDVLNPNVSVLRNAWAVGLAEGTYREADATQADVEQALAETVRDWPHCRYFGTWVDDGRVHVDPVMLTRSRPLALAAARQFRQKAIYHLATGETIATD